MSNFEENHNLAQEQLNKMMENGEITENLDELLNVTIDLLKNLDEDEDLYDEAQELIPLLKEKVIPKEPTYTLLRHFEIFEPFSFIIPGLVYQLGFSIQNDEECIAHLENLKKILIEQKEPVIFLNGLISFLKNKEAEFNTSNLTALVLQGISFSDENSKKCQECVEYITSITE